MSKQRFVKTSFWYDSFIEKLLPKEKLLFLYLLTNELTDLCGVYEISIKRICFDTGLTKNEALKSLENFKKNDKIYYLDGFIFLKNFKKSQTNNPSVEKGIKRFISSY